MLKRRVWRPIAGIIFVITMFASALFLFMLLKVDILPAKYLLPFVGILILLICVAGLLLYCGLHRKRSVGRRVRRIIGVILCILITAASLYGTWFLMTYHKVVTDITSRPENEVRAVVGVYVKNDDPAQSISDMAGYRFAVLGDLGDEKIHSNYAIAKINETLGYKVETVSCSTIAEAAEAVRNGQAQALAVSKQFLAMLENSDVYKSFAEEIKLIDEISVPKTATLDNTPIVIDTVEPTPGPTPEPTPVPTPEPPVYGEDTTLIFYLGGTDKWEEGVSNTHGDVNLLMLVNTKTRQILLINTPRDYWVTNAAINRLDKLTNCGIVGVNNSIATLEKYYEIKIDNYVKVNFRGFVTFIDEIGGITIDNPVAFSTTLRNNAVVNFPVGEITLGGTDALGYARERHAFANGDLGRGQNHLRVLTAIINKLKSSGPSLMMKYPEILNSMSGYFETDLSYDQISDLIKIATRYLNEWEIKSYGVFGGSGKGVTSAGYEEYFIFPNNNSVAFAKRLMTMVLNDEIITDEVLAEAPRY